MFSRTLLHVLLALPVFAQPSVSVSTFAGVPGVPGHEDGSTINATFNRPTWLDVVRGNVGAAMNGDVFVVDRANNAVRRISGGQVSTYSVATTFDRTPVEFNFGGPFGGGIAIEPAMAGCGAGIYDSGMFVASTGAQQIAHVGLGAPFLAQRDDVSPIIGMEGAAGSRDGREVEAQFNHPTGLARSWIYANSELARTRSIYVADTGNHTIRRLRFVSSFEFCPQAKFVETLAGRAGEPGAQDGTGAQARFNTPRGVVSGPDGSVYVADSGNHTIRRIAPDGRVTTIAGQAGVAGSVDGPALLAQLNTPSGIDINESGEIFIADTGNATVRMLTTDGRLLTIAGVAGVAGNLDGPGASALFSGPVGLRIAPDGSILVADPANNTIRRLSFETEPRRRGVGR